MNNIIAEICESSISILEKNLEQIIKTSKVFNLSELTEEMHKITNAIGLRAIKELIEKLGEEIENDPERLKQGYKIHKKNVKRELITEMGRLVYERTYYRKAEEGYVFLLDELLSVDKYTRVEKGLSAKIVSSAVEKSYKKAASDTGNIVSAQTVMNKVRNAETLQIAAEPKTFEGTPEELHIFADEDHVTYKDGKKGIVKFAVLSEGKEQVYEYRNRLINRVAFATVTKSNEEFWSEVLGYITQRYDMAKVKCIYLHADGGTWIKKAEEIIPNLKVYLDEFHIRKYLRKLPKEKEYKEIVNAIYKSLDINDKEEFTVQIEKLNNMVSDEKLKKKTEEVKKYIENNWEPVVNRLSKEITGSCTEAMNDHICAERISYHGCAWDRYSLEKLITERIYILNGGVIIAENMDKEKCVIEKDENGHRRIKRFEPKEKNLHAKYFEEQFKANIQNLDFSMFDNHHEYRFFGPVNDIISILGHKRIFSA